MKKQIKVYIERLEPLDSNSVDTFIETLMKLKSEHESTYTDLRFDNKHDCGCWHHCSCAATPYLVGFRLETDEEYAKRLEKDKQVALEQIKREKALLDELTKKYKDEIVFLDGVPKEE